MDSVGSRPLDGVGLHSAARQPSGPAAVAAGRASSGVAVQLSAGWTTVEAGCLTPRQLVIPVSTAVGDLDLRQSLRQDLEDSFAEVRETHLPGDVDDSSLRPRDMRRLLLSYRALSLTGSRPSRCASPQHQRPAVGCSDHFMELPVQLAESTRATGPCRGLGGIFKRKHSDRKLPSSPLAVRRSVR